MWRRAASALDEQASRTPLPRQPSPACEDRPLSGRDPHLAADRYWRERLRRSQGRRRAGRLLAHPRPPSRRSSPRSMERAGRSDRSATKSTGACKRCGTPVYETSTRGPRPVGLRGHGSSCRRRASGAAGPVSREPPQPPSRPRRQRQGALGPKAGAHTLWLRPP